MHRQVTFFISSTVVLAAGMFTAAGPSTRLASSVVEAQQQALTAPGDQAAIERGQQLLIAQCGFCHGSNARGGASGPDLTRSVLVQTDENGKQLGEFLRVGRPDKGMPKFDLSDAQVSDLAAFLHATIYLASNRRLYKILDILTGDAKAGEAFFNGAGRCRTCHSPAGDLKGVGVRYSDPAVLQGRMILPRGLPPDQPPVPSHRLPNALRVTVTSPGGESVSGTLVRLTDFEVTLFDAKSGSMRSWLRSDDGPKVVVSDPLQAHVDMLTKWTDADMHNVTAYLATLK
ncbi:MAG TPA: cytochrome c [Vicinamibacterales bacterium]|nr:cytochrome c [Vicinamibacterales bacterium]